MSVIVAKGAQITQCTINTSSSNQMYSFSKDKRFKVQHQAKTNNFYNIPSSIKTPKNSSVKAKSTTFGYSERSFLIKKSEEPKTYYYQESMCQVINKPTSTLGKAPNIKEKYKTISNDSHNLIDSTLNSSKYLKNAKITIKGRPKSVFDIKDNNIPGPGKYYNNSAIFNLFKKEVNTSNFSHSTEKRFKETKDNEIPGPIYQPENLTIKAKISSSIFGRMISKSKRTFDNANIQNNQCK